MLFKLLHKAPISEAVFTRDGTIYFMRGLRFAFLYPPEPESLAYRIRLFIVGFLFVIYLPLSFLLGFLKYSSVFGIADMLTTLQIAFNVVGGTMRYVILYCLRRQFERTNAVMDLLDRSCTKDYELRRIRDVVAFTNRVFATFFVVYVSYANFSLVNALLNRRPPFTQYYPYLDWQASKQQLYVQTMIEYVFTTFAIYSNMILDIYPVVYVELLRAHVNIFKLRLGQLGSDGTMSAEAKRKAIIDCIEDHKNLLLYCDTIRPVIALTLFVQFFVCGCAIGTSMINLMFFFDITHGVPTAIYLFGVIMQTFPLCFACNSLVDNCDELPTALFHSNWVCENKEYRKIVLFFMHKLQSPMTFAAIGVFPINVQTNISFAKFAFTIVTLAKDANIADKLADEN